MKTTRCGIQQVTTLLVEFGFLKRITLPVIGVATAFMTSSCATVFMRSDSLGDATHIYPATVFDAQFFWECGIKGKPPLLMAEPDVKSEPLARVAYSVGAVIDMPFSIVSDTALLPVDLYRLRTRAMSDEEAHGKPQGAP